MIQQIFKRSGKGAAIDRAGHKDRISLLNPYQQRRRIIAILLRRTAVSERNPIIRQIDQSRFETVNCPASLDCPRDSVEHPPRWRNTSQNRYKLGHNSNYLA